MDINDCVGVKTLDLSDGCLLQHPIYSEHGVLLVSKGTTFTGDIQRLLMKRRIEDVRIHQDDVEAALCGSNESRKGPVVPLDTELAAQIDETISAGPRLRPLLGAPTARQRAWPPRNSATPATDQPKRS